MIQLDINTCKENNAIMILLINYCFIVMTTFNITFSNVVFVSIHFKYLLQIEIDTAVYLFRASLVVSFY